MVTGIHYETKEEGKGEAGIAVNVERSFLITR